MRANQKIWSVGRADLVQLVSILAQKNGIPSTDCNIENVVKSFCGQQIGKFNIRFSILFD